MYCASSQAVDAPAFAHLATARFCIHARRHALLTLYLAALRCTEKPGLSQTAALNNAHQYHHNRNDQGDMNKATQGIQGNQVE